jgi:hypothetical protein
MANPPFSFFLPSFPDPADRVEAADDMVFILLLELLDMYPLDDIMGLKSELNFLTPAPLPGTPPIGDPIMPPPFPEEEDMDIPEAGEEGK